ncbi:MAG TPA: redoxin domain-containing protein [Polyangiaceae bacterium]|nr:redoxin domain-containing protein [Polyangiaceae bacterium]
MLLLACAPPPSALDARSALSLRGSDARVHDVRKELAEARFTVFVFAAKSCACLDAHAPRLRALHDEYSQKGVAFRLVDSEVGASPSRAMQLARRSDLGFPALADPGARLADALGAAFASHTVIVDEGGRIRYSGGIDSDAARLHDDAKLYVRDALDDLLAGNPPRQARSEALGCSLELR